MEIRKPPMREAIKNALKICQLKKTSPVAASIRSVPYFAESDEHDDDRHRKDDERCVGRQLPAIQLGEWRWQQPVASQGEQAARSCQLEADPDREDVEEDGQVDPHREEPVQIEVGHRCEVEDVWSRADCERVLGHDVERTDDQNRRDHGDRDRPARILGLLAEGRGELEPDEHQDREQQSLEDRSTLGDVARRERLQAVAFGSTVG